MSADGSMSTDTPPRKTETASPLFVGNVTLDGMLFARAVRSEQSFARIVRIHPPVLPEGYTFVTAADLPVRARTVSVLKDEIPVLAASRVSYRGEPVGLVAGPDWDTVESLRSQTSTTYEALEPRFEPTEDPEEAFYAREVVRGDPAGAFLGAFQSVEGTYDVEPPDMGYTEPMGVVVAPVKGGYDVYAPTVWPHHLRRSVAAALEVTPGTIRVHQTDVAAAGSTCLWYPTYLAIQATVLARMRNSPVALYLDADEDFALRPREAPVRAHYRTALNSSGDPAALEADIRVNVGAIPVLSGEVADRIALRALGAYRCEDARVRVRCYTTNLPPLGSAVSFGEAAAACAAETHAARLVDVAQLDPVEWKQRNLLRRGDHTLTNQRLKASVDRTDVLGATAAAADFRRKHAAFELLRKRGSTPSRRGDPTRGIGIAFGMQGDGFTAPREAEIPTSVSVVLEEDRSARVAVSSVPYTRRLIDAWRENVAALLAVPAEGVRVASGGTSDAPDSGPSVLSRNVAIVQRLIENACASIKRRRFKAPLPLEATRTAAGLKRGKWDDDTFEGRPYVSESCAAAVVEVEFDPVRLSVATRRLWLTADIGTIVDRECARARLRASCHHALDWAGREAAVLYEGIFTRTVNAISPPGIGTPETSIELASSAGRGRTSEACGLDRLPYSCVPAAYLAAVSQASGHYADRIPASSHLLHGYLEHAEEAEGSTS